MGPITAVPTPADAEALREHLGLLPEERPKLEFLHRLIQRSSPYVRAAATTARTPIRWSRPFARWLENQPEPLRYNLNDPAGKREIILSSGGILETIRVLLTALSEFLQVTPARIFTYRLALPEEYRSIPRLQFQTLPDDESAARAALEDALNARADLPALLLTRRAAR